MSTLPQPLPQTEIKLTRKNGTPLNVTSVLEEDIVEICVTLGHTHPLGVLWYSAMELVALFCTTEEMQWASCSAIKATELWDEPIAVQTVAPSEHHLRAYIAILGGDPSKPHLHPQRGRVNPIHPLITLTQVGRLCVTSRQSLATSLTKSCINSWRISTRRLHSVSCMHPPAILNQHLGENHQGVGILMGMTRRSPFGEGEGGFPQDTYPHLQPQHDWMEDGFLRDHLLNPQCLLHQIQMWGAWSALWHRDYAWVPQE